MTDSQPQLDSNGVEWTRVRDKETGHHYSVSVVDPDIHQELKQPALDANGSPLPPKPRVESARSTTASADTKEK